MELILVGVVLLGVVAWLVIKLLVKPAVSRQPVRAPSSHQGLASPARAPATRALAVELPEPEIPPALKTFSRLDATALTEAQQQALLERLKTIPRPPRALQQLTSPTYLQTASSAEVAELVMGEPALAAKVLATVNSPLYGLQKPVAHLGQGITFLGLNSVRSICMQHMLNQSFAGASPQLRPAFEHYWQASAIGSELCARLASKLGMPEGGVMVTQVVLSFLGPMAALTLLPTDSAGTAHTLSLLERTQLEQDHLGLSGSALGQLLMTSWGLPDPIVHQVTHMDRCLEQPFTVARPEATVTALSYWCARVGEQLASHPPADWSSHQWLADTSVDTALVRPYLEAVLGDTLTATLQYPGVAQSMTALISSKPQAMA